MQLLVDKTWVWLAVCFLTFCYDNIAPIKTEKEVAAK